MDDGDKRAAERLVTIERVAEIALDHVGGFGGGASVGVERLARGRAQRKRLADEALGARGADGLPFFFDLGALATLAPEKTRRRGELGIGRHGNGTTDEHS